MMDLQAATLKIPGSKRQLACLVSMSEERVIGPLFTSLDEANKFLEWMGVNERDPRKFEHWELKTLARMFRRETEVNRE